MQKIIIGIFCAIFLLGCNLLKPKEKPEALARVGEHYLLKKDVIDRLEINKLSKKDSIKVVGNYIDNWIMKQTLLQNARSHLTQEQLFEIDEKVLEYKQSLVSFLYEGRILNQRLNKEVSDSIVNNYFEQNKKDFTIQEPVIKYFRIKSDKPFSNEKRKEIKKWLESFLETGNDSELKEFCSFEAIDCYSDIENWVLLSDFHETMSIENSKNTKISLNKNKLNQYKGGKYYYLYQIIDQKSSGTYPEDYVKNKIKKIILRQREQEFLEDLRKNIYETAKIKNEIEIYND